MSVAGIRGGAEMKEKTAGSLGSHGEGPGIRFEKLRAAQG